MADYSMSYEITHDEAAGWCAVKFRCFDTPNVVKVFCGAGDPFGIEGVLTDVRRDCLRLHRLWSFSLAGSDIARLNGEQDRVEVDALTAELLSAMKGFHACEPAFDFTVGPLSFLWKRASEVPSAAELAGVRSLVGAGRVSIAGNIVEKADPLMKVDVGGAAKGFAADRIARRLRAAGIEQAVIDLGGNLVLLGAHPAGRPWRVAVRVPDGVPAGPLSVEVTGKSVVTSGNYERFVEIGGVRYQHVIDPRTGWPSEGDLVSATVVAESSLQADMLATTALIAGSAGLAGLKARHPDEEFIAITAGGRVLRA